MKVYKYELAFGAVVTLSLPVEAKVLSAGFQGDKVVIWVTEPVASDPIQSRIVSRRFAVAPTGVDTLDLDGALSTDGWGMSFVATIQAPQFANPLLPNGIVAHVWEV